MKKIFNSKNMNLFVLLFTICTIGVSIFNLIRGVGYDYLGYWHAIYRALFLLFLIVLIDVFRSFSFKNSLWGLLSQLLPLLLIALAFAFIRYLDGSLDFNNLLRYILYAIGFVAAIALIMALCRSIMAYITRMFKGKKKYFSFMSLLLIVLLIIPMFIYYYFNTTGNILFNVFENRWILIGTIFLGLVFVVLLLSTKLKDTISVLNIVFLVLYYIFWLIITYIVIGVVFTQIVLGLLFVCLLIYELTNTFHHCIAFTVISYLLLFIGFIYYFA